MADEQPDVLKDAFAAALLRTPHDPFRAACAVFGTDTGRALRVSREWLLDSYVITKQAELLQTYGADNFLPDKSQVARDAYELSQNPRVDARDRIAALKLLSELQGFISNKTEINQNLQVNNNRVMIMRDHGTDEDWEEKARAQQAKLVSNARD